MFAVVKRVSLLASLLVLVLAASAPAATTTVDASSAGGCAAGATCKSISQAIGASKAGDTIVIKKGTYIEDITVPADRGGLTLKADTGAIVHGTLASAATDVKVSGLAIKAAAGPSAVTAAGKISLTDVAVVSETGTALTLNGGTGSRVQRSTLASGDANSNTSDGIKQGAAGLTVDSSIVIGGARGAAFRVTTTNGSADASLALNHVTSVTPGAGIALLGPTSDNLALDPVGDITLTVTSSIIRGASGAISDPGFAVLGVPVRPANSVTATFANSNASKFIKPDGQPAAGSGNATANSALFASPGSLRLKHGSPAIDQGGPLAAGESTTDIDGDPRVNGPASDIGADEFTNHAPVLTLSVLPEVPRTGQKVVASGRAADREGGSDLNGFLTEWGDGSPRVTSSTSVLEHVYDKPGTYTVRMITRDKSGEWSNLAEQTITVVDADPPRLQLTAPAPGTTVRLNSDSGHKRLRIAGTATDATGVAAVEVALTKRGKKNKCLQYVGNTFGKGACDNYVFLPATIIGDTFALRTQKDVVIPTGSYRVRVRGRDVGGSATSRFSKASGTLVAFRVR
jgi:hypothetical protein